MSDAWKYDPDDPRHIEHRERSFTKDSTHQFHYEVIRDDLAEHNPKSRHYGGCRYFVLDLDHDPHAIAAVLAYADSCRSERPTLAAELDEKYRR